MESARKGSGAKKTEGRQVETPAYPVDDREGSAEEVKTREGKEKNAGLAVHRNSCRTARECVRNPTPDAPPGDRHAST